MQVLTTRVWPTAGLSLMIAGSISYLVVALWEQWALVIVLVYAIYLLEGVTWLPSKTMVGNAISVGVHVGLFIPLVLLFLWRH